MEVLKDLRLRSVVANGDEGKRQRCNESESEVESDWESEARAIWVKDVVADDDKGEKQTGRDERCNESEREAESERAWLREWGKGLCFVWDSGPMPKPKRRRSCIRGKKNKESRTVLFKAWNTGLVWTAWTGHGSQNRAVGPWSVRVIVFFAWNGFSC